MPHPQYMEVPGPGVESKLQLWQCWILNPLLRAGDWTWASAATGAAAIGFLTHHAIAGTPRTFLFTTVRGNGAVRRGDPGHIGGKKKGTKESVSLTVAKQNQESRQRESTRLAATERSCTDFQERFWATSSGPPQLGPGESGGRPPSPGLFPRNWSRMCWGRAAGGCRICSWPGLGSKPVSVDFAQHGNKCSEGCFPEACVFERRLLILFPKDRWSREVEELWCGSSIAVPLANGFGLMDSSEHKLIMTCEWAKSFTKENSWKMLLEDPLAVWDKSQFALHWRVSKQAILLIPPKIFRFFISRSFSVICSSAQKLVWVPLPPHLPSYWHRRSLSVFGMLVMVYNDTRKFLKWWKYHLLFF